MLHTYSNGAFRNLLWVILHLQLFGKTFFTLPVDAVNGVSLLVPSVAVEGRNVSLQCSWTAGTEITVQWGKGGATITADSRITFSGGFLIINPARRADTGDYTCTVSNLVSAQTATQSLTVYCEFLCSDQDKWQLICCSQCK